MAKSDNTPSKPKGTVFKGSDGKYYKSLGGGKSQGMSKKPKMKKTKKAGTVVTKKRKPSKRKGSSSKIKKSKMGGYTKKRK